MLEAQAVDLIISDMRMPEMDGARLLEQVRLRWPDTVRILLTGYADMASTIDAINKGRIYRYISKPWNDDEILLTVRHGLERRALERDKARLEALTSRQNEELRDLNANLELKVMERTVELGRANERLKTGFLTSIKVFSNLIELRETSLAGHSRRVADLARRIAQHMALSGDEIQDIFVAGLLHDIGKIGLPDSLLARSVANLSGEAQGLYRKHPLRGEQSLMALAELRGAATLVRAHHERFDGKGYPDGLAGLAIPVGARILAVANDFDGLQIGIVTPHRLSPAAARKLIIDSRGKRYDPLVIDAFIEVVASSDSETRGEKLVPVGELKVGMKLARDLTRDGAVLLAADYTLDDRLIRQINDYAANEGIRLSLHIRVDSR